MSIVSSPPAGRFYKIANGMPVIDVGALRHTITIQQQNTSGFDASGVAVAWTTLTTAQAAIDFIKGTDVIKGGQTTAQQFLEVTLWFQAGITPNMRVQSASSMYLIQSVE